MDGGYVPGGPGAKPLGSQCRVPGFNPWSGNSILHAAAKTWHSRIKKKEKKILNKNKGLGLGANGTWKAGQCALLKSE